jgi:hypothetical protein
MSKLVAVMDSIVAQADAAVAEANKAIGGDDECTEAQIAGIVDGICTNRNHETADAVRADVRAAMKAKGYVFKAPKPEKAAK